MNKCIAIIISVCILYSAYGEGESSKETQTDKEKIITEGKKNKEKEYKKLNRPSKGFRLVDYSNIAGSTYYSLDWGLTYNNGELQYLDNFSVSYNVVNHIKGIWRIGASYVRNDTYTQNDVFGIIVVEYQPILWSLPIVDLRPGFGMAMGYQNQQDFVLNTQTGYYTFGGDVRFDVVFKLWTYFQISTGVVNYMLLNTDMAYNNLFFYRVGFRLFL